MPNHIGFVLIHDCAHTSVPRLDCAHTITMQMDNNYNCVHKIVRQLEWSKPIILNYCWRRNVKCDTVQLSPAVLLLKYFIILNF